ncbi:MAG TPA: preprotein translocase subunit SecG [Geminicoccus sp.]|jgi:preprotein translocase subunit SecG|uniref:preprotein translocase subunit SecG n=1 Tax=Geminicoccus sp. TaxID=2024832 RepID=UPI002E32F8B7|nr:preprotein translocase subunit SecG [Geminicoccus sp.]HEX2527682.1 preprotein translocase subunit SecG [Geminicoccus sp.]
MQTVILVIHLLIAVALVGLVLIQRSEGGGLGLGGGGGGGAGFMTARGATNFLTRSTAILAGCFVATSLVLAILAGSGSSSNSIFDDLPEQPAPVEQPAAPAAPAGPAAPIAQ